MKRPLNPDVFSLALLLLAVSVIMGASIPNIDTFYQAPDGDDWRTPQLHNALTSNTLAIAANRSPEHGVVGFFAQLLTPEGGRTYHLYNRFPIGGYLIVKAAVTPFPDDLAAQISAARVLMWVFFAATVVTAFLSMRRLTASSGVSLAATLLAFSSFATLHYSIMVANDGVMDLFGVMLTFHGMVVFVQEGRFRQLVLKTCAAILLGWHVFALLLPFIVFGLAGEYFRGRPGVSRMMRSRHLLLGVIALLFGLSMLALNFAQESAAVASTSNSPRPALADLPSYRSIMKRTGLDPEYLVEGKTDWRSVAGQLRHRAGLASRPYLMSPEHWALNRWVGILVPVACLVGLVFARYRILLATLAVSGCCWWVLMRHSSVYHGMEDMFLVGLPLVFYCLVLLQVRRLSQRLVGVCAAAALLVFVLSSLQAYRQNGHWDDATVNRAIISDFDAIRGIAPEGAVVSAPYTTPDFIPSFGATAALPWFLSGRIIAPRHVDGLCDYNNTRRYRARIDFVLVRGRHPWRGLLTPDNREVFLYDYPTLCPSLEGRYDYPIFEVEPLNPFESK